MGNDLQAKALGASGKDNYKYKDRHAVRTASGHSCPTQPLDSFSLKRVTSYTVGIMVSIWFLAKVFMAFAPLTGVVAQYSTAPVLPALINATADELIAGLEAGQFTSLDLVQVSIYARHSA